MRGEGEATMRESTQPHWITVPQIGDSQLGYISVAEFGKQVPFEIRRVYWTYYTPNDVLRGGHAHRELHQLIFAVSGHIEINVVDRHLERHTFQLDRPSEGVYVPPMCWRDLRFSHSAVLLCLASSEYNEADYFRTFAEFEACLSK